MSSEWNRPQMWTPNARSSRPAPRDEWLDSRQLADLQLLFRKLEIVIDHDLHELLETNLRLPSELLFRLRRIADEKFNLRGTFVALVVFHVLLPIEAEMTE